MAENGFFGAIEKLADRILQGIADVGDYGTLTFKSLLYIFRRPFNWPEIIKQMEYIGVASLVIVTLTALFTGMVMALQSSYVLAKFGAKMYIGKIVSLSLLRELGPVLTSLMVCGRVGSGIAAEIGSMVVTEQVDALRTMGLDPVKRLVSPRVLAGLLMLPILTIYADVVGLFGGYLISALELKIATSVYISSIKDTITFYDVFSGLGKTFFFGMVITTVACYYGLNTTGGTAGVGRSTTNAVVVGSLTILILDFFLTKAFMLF